MEEVRKKGTILTEIVPIRSSLLTGVEGLGESESVRIGVFLVPVIDIQRIMI